LSASKNGSRDQLFISSALLAWVFPGLGYFHRGEFIRGLCVMVSVLTLILVGVLVGGVHVCDAQRSPGYGLVQKLSLPGLALNVVAKRVQQDPLQAVDNTGGRPEEIGLIFTGVAGLLNLMAIAGSLTALPVKHQENQDGNPDPASPVDQAAARAMDHAAGEQA
jgi:hypothetical protein